ncbi:MAG: aldose 1-epimerase family protein [Fuerstiella sp.]
MRAAFFYTILYLLPQTGVAQEPFRQTLTSTTPPLNQTTWAVDAAQVTPDCPHQWSIRKETLRGGRQEGVDVITVNNGQIEIVLCPTRGMGILNVTMGELQLKWDSPVQEVVHPQYVNLTSRGGLGWLEGFNEFLCRCGLESNGHPGTDKFINNVGDEAEMELTLHGKIANIPASHVEVVVDRTEPFALHIKAQVNEKMLFGPKLELHTELVVIPGEDTFQLIDEIKNTGAQEQEFQILYHANFGAPLLEEGAAVVAPVKQVTPFNAHAASGMEQWNVYSGPTTGFIEQVYLLELKADHNRHTTALLHNKQKNKAASISWSLDELPYLTVWKNTGATADGYVTGIEPGTNYPNNRSVERAAGRVPKLAPGESRTMRVSFGLHDGVQAVEAALESVRAISLSGEPVDDIKVPAIQRQLRQ